MTPPTILASDCSYMSRNMVQMDGGLAVRTHAIPFCRSLLPRTLLTSERGLQTTLGVKVEGPFKGENLLH